MQLSKKKTQKQFNSRKIESFLPFGTQFIYIYPIFIQDKKLTTNKKIKPYRFTINRENQKVKDLIQKLRCAQKNSPICSGCHLSDPDGRLIKNFLTIKQLKSTLRRDKIHGMKFYLSQPESDLNSSTMTHYSNECFAQYLTNYQLQGQNSECFQLNFKI